MSVRFFLKIVVERLGNHLSVKRFSVEGQLQCSALLFLPKRSTTLTCTPIAFCSSVCNEFIPEWLIFVMARCQSTIMREIMKFMVKKKVEMIAEFHPQSSDDHKKFFEHVGPAMIDV